MANKPSTKNIDKISNVPPSGGATSVGATASPTDMGEYGVNGTSDPARTKYFESKSLFFKVMTFGIPIIITIALALIGFFVYQLREPIIRLEEKFFNLEKRIDNQSTQIDNLQQQFYMKESIDSQSTPKPSAFPEQ